jgi:hypothetical protein
MLRCVVLASLEDLETSYQQAGKWDELQITREHETVCFCLSKTQPTQNKV